MRYVKAPILEAVLEFRWESAKSLDELESVLGLSHFERFGAPTPRIQIGAAFDLHEGSVQQQRHQLGFEVASHDGSEIVFLEDKKFVFVQRAPYDRWEHFSGRALTVLTPAITALGVSEFSRVGLRFVNRIDIPDGHDARIDTDTYMTIKFDGPRQDLGIIEEFQMRVVKPIGTGGMRYALVVATTPSPLPEHSAILLDIDVFTEMPISANGEDLMRRLDEMRTEKNDIFEKCLTDETRALFGEVVE